MLPIFIRNRNDLNYLFFNELFHVRLLLFGAINAIICSVSLEYEFMYLTFP